MSAGPDPATVAAHFLVRGRVQGVGFRASARNRAIALGLYGFARNLSDGRVETLAQGPAAAVDAFESWLQQGPSFAHVDAVQRLPAAVDAQLQGFDIA